MRIARFLLHILGWKLIQPSQPHPPKSIICVAPHTSNWDFILGKLYSQATGRKALFLMKKAWFFFPLGYLLKSMGGIPVDRSGKGNKVAAIVQLFAQKSHLSIAITPEGTRSARERWKTGFYRIAQQARIPIQLAVIDYKKKRLGIFENFIPTNDMEADLLYIRSRYHSSQSKYPHLFVDVSQ